MKNGERKVSELGDLVGLFETKSNADTTLNEFELNLTPRDRELLYQMIPVGDFYGFEEWAGERSSKKWKPTERSRLHVGATGSGVVKPKGEPPETGPFGGLDEFAGRQLTRNGFNRLAGTPADVLGFTQPETFGELILQVYRHGQAAGKELSYLEAFRRQLAAKLPVNLTTDELMRLVTREATHSTQQYNDWVGREITDTPGWRRFYSAPAILVAKGEPGCIRDLLIRTYVKAEPGMGLESIRNLIIRIKDRLPLNATPEKLTMAVRGAINYQKKREAEGKMKAG